eukprot:4741107-Amphidinium_carterae.1
MPSALGPASSVRPPDLRHHAHMMKKRIVEFEEGGRTRAALHIPVHIHALIESENVYFATKIAQVGRFFAGRRDLHAA